MRRTARLWSQAMCVPPCRQYTIHARSKTDPTAWVANGTSVFQGGCCAFLNQGDTTFWMVEGTKDGSSWPARMELQAGYGPAIPPCFAGKKMAYFVEAGVKKGGAPSSEEIVR